MNSMSLHKGIKLRFAIVLLTIIAVFFNNFVNWYTSTNVLKSTLTDNYLEHNYADAEELASNTSDLLNRMQNTINGMGKTLGHTDITQEHLDERLTSLSDYFNSLFILDTNGVIQLSSPSVIQFTSKVQSGDKIESAVVEKALATKEAFISEPYKATSGRLIMLISAPIFNTDGQYQGLIGGTIYLEDSENAISKLLNVQHSDGSYVFVVDDSGRIIYHPDGSRVNEDVSDNDVVAQILQGKSGTSEVTNNNDKDYLTGYVYEKSTGWGIITQTPASIIQGPINQLLLKQIFISLPFLLLTILIVERYISKITKPLHQLAKFSEDSLLHKGAIAPLESLKIKSKIYEVVQLSYHMYNHFELLNRRIQIDGLTGLANRRTFDIEIKELIDHQTPFTMIMLDIDRFKKVNDTYGHLIGDDTLKYLSAMIYRFADEDKLCFRYGGEEFVILLKGTTEQQAWTIAERLREKTAQTESPTGQPITISLGISASRRSDYLPEEIIKRADTALFQSKNDGRNKTTIYSVARDSLQS